MWFWRFANRFSTGFEKYNTQIKNNIIAHTCTYFIYKITHLGTSDQTGNRIFQVKTRRDEDNARIARREGLNTLIYYAPRGRTDNDQKRRRRRRLYIGSEKFAVTWYTYTVTSVYYILYLYIILPSLSVFGVSPRSW